MSAAELIKSFAVEAARLAVQWAVDQVRAKARKAGILVDDEMIAKLCAAELASLHLATQAIASEFAAAAKRGERGPFLAADGSPAVETIIVSPDEPFVPFTEE